MFESVIVLKIMIMIMRTLRMTMTMTTPTSSWPLVNWRTSLPSGWVVCQVRVWLYRYLGEEEREEKKEEGEGEE